MRKLCLVIVCLSYKYSRYILPMTRGFEFEQHTNIKILFPLKKFPSIHKFLRERSSFDNHTDGHLKKRPTTVLQKRCLFFGFTFLLTLLASSPLGSYFLPHIASQSCWRSSSSFHSAFDAAMFKVSKVSTLAFPRNNYFLKGEYYGITDTDTPVPRRRIEILNLHLTRYQN